MRPCKIKYKYNYHLGSILENYLKTEITQMGYFWSLLNSQS